MMYENMKRDRNLKKHARWFETACVAFLLLQVGNFVLCLVFILWLLLINKLLKILLLIAILLKLNVIHDFIIASK